MFIELELCQLLQTHIVEVYVDNALFVRATHLYELIVLLPLRHFLLNVDLQLSHLAVERVVAYVCNVFFLVR